MSPSPTLLPLAGVLPLVLLSCGILGGLSEEEQARLEIYRKNAQQYFEEASASNQPADYRRSLDQINKGLTIVPGDYRLRSQRAMCLLMLGKHRDPDRLLEAEQAFKRVMGMRSDADHDPKTILGYGLTLHRLGYIERARAEILEDQIKIRGASSSDSNDPRARADEHRARARAYFEDAEQQLLKLRKKEDFLVLAYQHLMNLKEHQGDRAAAKKYGRAFLAECAKQREYWENKYKTTTLYRYERQRVVPALQELERSELAVRDALSFMCRQDRDFKKAIEHLDRMLAMRPNEPIYYYNRGDCYRALGKDAAAKRDFKKFLGTTALPPEHPKVKHAFEYTYRQ